MHFAGGWHGRLVISGCISVRMHDWMQRGAFMETRYTAQSRGLIHYMNPWELLKNVWRNRELIGQFTRREIQGRYRGSLLGMLWSFINPLVMLIIYTFVFGTIFKSRWPGINKGNGLST
jgi:hypothetical protein